MRVSDVGSRAASLNTRVDDGFNDVMSGGSAMSTAYQLALTFDESTIAKICSQNCPLEALPPARSRYASLSHQPLR